MNDKLNQAADHHYATANPQRDSYSFTLVGCLSQLSPLGFGQRSIRVVSQVRRAEQQTAADPDARYAYAYEEPSDPVGSTKGRVRWVRYAWAAAAAAARILVRAGDPWAAASSPFGPSLHASVTQNLSRAHDVSCLVGCS